jgi:hypothetical protein
MNAVRQGEADRSLLRWGGLAGVLGGALMLFVFVFVGVVIGPDPAGPAGPVTRFPEIRALRTVENFLYLLVIALWAIHFLALGRALGGSRPASALTGSVLGIVGLTVMAAGALPHFVTGRLSALYHAQGASPEDQATVEALWQANQGLFDALLAVGLVLLAIALVVLGGGMLRAPAFGRVVGATTVVLGVMGLGSATAFLIDPLSPVVVVGFLALIVFSAVVGWKVHRLSRAPHVVPADLGDLRTAEGALAA